MSRKDPIAEDLNLMTNEDIEQSSDLQKALELINKEQIVPEAIPLVKKNFIVKKNENIKELSKLSLDERNDTELDEISDQADQAFYDLMDIAVNTGGKGCGEIASAAQSFLSIKLNARMAKTELKLKRLKQELDQKKFEESVASKNRKTEDDDDDDDDIVIFSEN